MGKLPCGIIRVSCISYLVHVGGDGGMSDTQEPSDVPRREIHSLLVAELRETPRVHRWRQGPVLSQFLR